MDKKPACLLPGDETNWERDLVNTDWVGRRSPGGLTGWLLRILKPSDENSVWKILRASLGKHRHGLGDAALFGATILAATCSFVPPHIVSFAVWYLIYLVYMPLGVLKIRRLLYRNPLGLECRLIPSFRQDAAMTARRALILVAFFALVPLGIYLGLLWGMEFRPGSVLEIALLLVAASACVASAGFALGKLYWAIPLLLAAQAYCLNSTFGGIRLKTLLLFPAGQTQEVIFGGPATVLVGISFAGLAAGIISAARLGITPPFNDSNEG